MDRNRSTSRLALRLALSLVALSAMVPGAVSPAAACSCVSGGAEFLDPGPAGLPANAAGVVWIGSIPDEDGDGSEAESFFTIERLTADGAVPLEVDVRLLVGGNRPGWDSFGTEWLDHEPILVPAGFSGVSVQLGEETVRVRRRNGPRDKYLHGTWIVAPESGLEPGATYSFVYGADRVSGDSKSTEDRTLIVTVRPDAVTRAGEVELRHGEPMRDLVRVAKSASCSGTIEAQRVGLLLELPEQVRRFAKSVFFTTLVRGNVWKPTASLCTVLPPGESWRGRGRDEIYLGCPGDDRYGRTVPEGLAAEPYADEDGVYEVEMIAWLPGRFEVARGRAEIELDCGEAK